MGALTRSLWRGIWGLIEKLQQTLAVVGSFPGNDEEMRLGKRRAGRERESPFFASNLTLKRGENQTNDMPNFSFHFVHTDSMKGLL